MTGARRLSLVDCLAIGINGVVGAGVYLTLGQLAGRAGAASVVGIVACGMLCTLIALCFAETAGMFDRSGGAYVYAREAFGRPVGFAVGWMSLCAGVLGYAAVSVGFSTALAEWVPSLAARLLAGLTGKSLVTLAVIVLLGLLNWRGVKLGAGTVDVLALLKLLPLVAVALGGLALVRTEVLAAMLPREGWLSDVAGAAVLAVFMTSGFEFVAVPAGETSNPTRNVPIAVVSSLLAAVALYALLQLAALSAFPDLPKRAHPLPDLGAVVFGALGRTAIAAAAVVSTLAFCAGSALVVPRYFTALAEDGLLPRALLGTSRFGTPGSAIAVTSVIAAALGLWLDFGALVDVTAIVLFAQYLPTALAVPVLRWRRPDAPRRYRVPFGPVIPLGAAALSVGMLVLGSPSRNSWVLAGEMLGVGVVVVALAALGRAVKLAPGQKPG